MGVVQPGAKQVNSNSIVVKNKVIQYRKKFANNLNFGQFLMNCHAVVAKEAQKTNDGIASQLEEGEL